ncbi:hypothetical protein B0T16DRAFT_172228 [Cercophora newfieldiana]|uniref:Uncharacterized protein n=1 Tax=Cercophora newfieldiana TaxID=92897 RepID=A0AA39Y6P7_9PEZI|nr:hypothetical protein B0T16DRAFT_172228 [Cercophora newfieldiana]
MAAADVLLPSIATPNWPSPSETATIPPTKDAFDPKKHLNFTPPAKVFTMKDIGLPEDTGVSPLAVSEPFPLFTPEAIMRMREEVLSNDVLTKCQYSSNLAQAQLRGYADKYAPFVYDAWKHPTTLAAVSQVAGIDLTLQFDFEIGHINLSFKTEEQKQRELQAYLEGIASNTPTDDMPIVGWHRDSYPFVCVTMLSDCREMIGGETALRMGTGEVLKVRGPQMGHAVVLQGRYIEHQALRALGAMERITMVTSYRPRSPRVRDDTVLTTVRPISDLSELYYQFAKYRLEIMEERIREQLRELVDTKMAGRKIALKKMKAFLAEQEHFLAHTNREMVEEDEVAKSMITSH